MTTEPMCRRCGKNPIFDISDRLCESCCFEVDASPQTEPTVSPADGLGDVLCSEWAGREVSLGEVVWDD